MSPAGNDFVFFIARCPHENVFETVVPLICQDGFETATFSRNLPKALVNFDVTISDGFELILPNGAAGLRQRGPAAQKHIWTRGAPGIIQMAKHIWTRGASGIIQMADHISVSRGGK